MAREKCLIKKEDKVKVISGKDNGKIGKVLRIDNKTNRILVEKINMVKTLTSIIFRIIDPITILVSRENPTPKSLLKIRTG